MKTKIISVEFELDGQRRCKQVKALQPGDAFAIILLKHPGARLIRCVWEGHLANKTYFPTVSLSYDAPKNLHLAAPVSEGENLLQATFPWA